MTVLFECVYEGERYVGYGGPEDAVLTLFPLAGADPRAAVLAADGDIPALLAALTEGREPVTAAVAAVRFRPPLLPDSVGDALVSGFMATHNVKADSGAPTQPNWFFKGLGEVLKVSGESQANRKRLHSKASIKLYTPFKSSTKALSKESPLLKCCSMRESMRSGLS